MLPPAIVQLTVESGDLPVTWSYRNALCECVEVLELRYQSNLTFVVRSDDCASQRLGFLLTAVTVAAVRIFSKNSKTESLQTGDPDGNTCSPTRRAAFGNLRCKPVVDGLHS